MNLRRSNAGLHSVFLLLVFSPALVSAQQPVAISGAVTGSPGEPVAGANVSATNTQTGQVAKTTADAHGLYTLTGLVPGAYTVSASAQGFTLSTSQLTLTAAPSQTLNITLAPAGAAQKELTLGDLGFTQQQTQSDPALQARLNRRTEMLKLHQKLGLITLAPMAAALITGPMAKVEGRDGQIRKVPSQANLDLHAALGSTTAALYFSSAYFAMFAPKVPGVQKRGAIRMHEALAFIHGPGMILTPILGAMAFKQEQDGEKVHGIASGHGAVAAVTVLAYGASIVAVSWPIHLKFWEKQ